MRRLLAALVAAAIPHAAWAWGPVGHRIVAETAALLVQDDLPATWGPLLARHRFELGVYSYLPDAAFRSEDGADGAIEAPTHFLNLDSPADAGSERGSVDRRIAQFLDLARGELADVRAPRGGHQRGASATGDARRIYLGLYDLGVMSHYSGDVAVPYHATADTNGFASGQGGVHFYFEADCVNALEPGLAEDVLSLARKSRARWVREWSTGSNNPGALVRAVLENSLATVATVSDLDRRHAVTKLASPGSREFALRRPADEGCRSMRRVLVDRLARGAVLTAALWETVLPKDADFSGAGSLHFSDMELGAAYVPPIK